MCPVDGVEKVYAVYDGALESEAAERSFDGGMEEAQ